MFFLIVVTAGVAFYFGEDIKIAGLLRETIKYLGFVVGVTFWSLVPRGNAAATAVFRNYLARVH